MIFIANDRSSNNYYRTILYFLCMKFQTELVNVQEQLENRVLCKTFLSRWNSDVQPSVTNLKTLKCIQIT